MDAGQIIHDIQDTYNTAVKNISDGEAAKSELKAIRETHKANIELITEESELITIENMLVKCEKAAD